MERLVVLGTLLLIIAVAATGAEPPRTFPYPRPLPEPTAEKLPRWRGFNLLYKFNANAAPVPASVMEEDFRLIASLGFNYARIPMDYRGWINGGDWDQIDATKLHDIDRIVALGGKYGVHVMLNFHRAPGYTVAKPAESRDLWTDEEAQRVCALHWAAFARRYRGIPNARLSFNLFNEPAAIAETVYFQVVKRMVDAIRAEDPARLVVCDGLDYGNVPPRSLRALGVALSTRGYRPMNVSHYRANWIAGSDTWAVPEWPAPQVSAYLYGNRKPDLQSPLVIDGPLGGTTLYLKIHSVSTHAKLRVTNQHGAVLWEHLFQPGPGDGEWKESVLRSEYQSYQATYDRDYPITIPAGTTRVEMRNVDGDWLTFSALSFEIGKQRWNLNPVDSWGLKQTGAVHFDPASGATALRATKNLNRAWLRDACYGDWREAESDGIGIMVGEFGAFRHTPHAVVLRWMDDLLATVNEGGWGWALWEFRGGFGVLDSKRSDVNYESWEGHALDRAMLDVLQKY